MRPRRPLAASGVRTIIVAGETGGSVPAVRARIERAWGARVIDHYGLTEVGPVAFEDWDRPGGLYVNEAEFIAEVLDAQGAPVPDGELGELVLTNLGRTASPVIRYRTGDIVRARTAPCPTGPAYLWLDGGILTRADDMVTIRGVNVYPTAVEAVVRAHADVTEFRATVARESAMRHLTVEIEVRPGADGAGDRAGRGAGAEGSARPHRRRARGRRQRPPALRDEGAAFRDCRCLKRGLKR